MPARLQQENCKERIPLGYMDVERRRYKIGLKK
jgi:hypothetical protein